MAETRRTGKDLAILINGVAIPVAREFTVVDRDMSANTTAAGDETENSESLRGTFDITWNSVLEVATPYVIPGNLRGQKVPFVGKLVDTEGASGFVSCLFARVEEFQVTVPHDGEVKISGALKPAGYPLAWDTTP